MPPVKIPAKTEYKTFQFKVENVDTDQGRVSGYLSTFNNIDAGNGYIRDRVRPGAFKKTLTEAKSRATNNNQRFLFPHLWMHDPERPTGGYVEALEDEKGLFVVYELDISCNGAGIPNNPDAMREFSGSKKGYISEQSIGYEVILSETNEQMIDGKKTYVRDLIEIRLVEGSGVTQNFAMNDQAQITGVKSLVHAEIKATVCGSTSGAIGPRDEAWDGGKAKAQIFAAAENTDGSLKASVCKKYFMLQDGDGSAKGDWSYPFWYVGDSPHICVSAVKAIAGAIEGARGANAPDGLKNKVATLYRRVNSKYPDDPELTPPWSDSGKSRARKSFGDHYQEAMCEDLLEDWGEVFLCALTCAMFEALQEGDQGACGQVLDDFKTFVMKNFVTQAEDIDLAAYLEENTRSYNLAENLMNYGSSGGYYGLMSRLRAPEIKQGARFSTGTKTMIQDHVDNLYGQADQMMSSMKAQTKSLTDAADALTNAINGVDDEDESETDDTIDGGDKNKSTRRGPSPMRTPSRDEKTTQPDDQDRTTEEDDLALAYQALTALNSKH